MTTPDSDLTNNASTLDQPRVGRRDAVLGTAAAGAGLLVGGAVLSSGLTAGEAPAPVSAGAEPSSAAAGRQLVKVGDDDAIAKLFGPIRPGSALAMWRVEEIYQVSAGAIPVILSTPNGVKFALEIFRDDPDLPPIARAGELGLYLSNRGRGSDATQESHGLGLMALAKALETRVANGAPIPPGLSTLGDRLRDEPRGAFDVPLV